MDHNGKICRLCLAELVDGNFKELDDVTTGVLEILSINFSIDNSQENLICDSCSANLIKVFDFKALCLDAEDTITPYYISNRMSIIDLKSIYMSEKKCTLSDLSHKKICRMCLQLVNEGDEMELDVQMQEMINKHMPEKNLSTTKDPVICRDCRDSLYDYNNFIEDTQAKLNCYEEQRSNDVESSNVLPSTSIKHESIDIKTEEYDEDSDTSSEDGDVKAQIEIEEFEEVPIKLETDPLVKKVTCPYCNFNSTDEISVETHIRDIHKQNQLFRCSKCNYVTIKRYLLNKHKVTHADWSQKKKNKSSRHKTDENLEQNTLNGKFKDSLINLEVSKDERKFACQFCNYRGLHRRYLRGHITNVHFKKNKNFQTSESEFQCKVCKRLCKTKHGLGRHMSKHKVANSKGKMLSCCKCDYVCWLHSKLKRHEAEHKDTEAFKCDKCGYETMYRKRFLLHRGLHELYGKTSETMYGCEKCSYRTFQKRYLRMHISRKHCNDSQAV